MNEEVIWLVVPIAGILSQIGGTWKKEFRRIAIPLLLAGAFILFYGFDWKVIPMALLQFGVFTLPFTLIGDDINTSILNWLWIPVFGILIASPPIVLNISMYLVGIVVGLLYAATAILSNVQKTAKYFPWKLVECFEGMAPAICFCTIATLS